MTEASPDDDPLVKTVRDQVRRAQAARTAFWRGLGTVGVGWTVSLPAVAGAALGRWLDSRQGTGIAWTLFLLAAGVVVGAFAAWRQLGRELKE